MSSTVENHGNSYEVLFILAGSLSESEVKKQLEKWEAEISGIGKILNKAVWDNRPLAYRISQEQNGTYFVANFTAAGDRIAELDRALRLDPKTIRHIIYRTPKAYVWQDYAPEDLEHDFSRLGIAVPGDTEENSPKKPKQKSFKKVSSVARAVSPKDKEDSEKPAEKAKADVGEIDRKLDDILADL